MIGCSKKNRENYQPENAFEQKKKKPRLKFNPGLAVIGLWTTGPRLPVMALPAHPRHQSLAFFRLRRLDTRSHPCLPGSGEEKVSTLNCSRKPRNRLKIFRELCSVMAFVCSAHRQVLHYSSWSKARILTATQRWRYTRRFATMIFSATQRCIIVVTLFRMVATLFQYCKVVLRKKLSLRIVPRKITLRASILHSPQ